MAKKLNKKTENPTEKIDRVQKELEALLAREHLTLIAQMNKETGVIMLEIIPTEMVEPMKEAMQAEKGDAIEAPAPTPAAVH